MTMARMPYTTWDPVSDGNSAKVCRPNIVCIHTIVGYAPAKAAHFSTRGDGYTWQHRDTERQSAANYLGNGDVIAIENADHGSEFPAWNTNDGHAVPGFTAAQIEAIAKILLFCYRAHGIPLVLVPDSKPGRRGIAYHRQGIDSPNNFAGYAYKGRVSGGVLWTTSTGKVCPGDRRITQLINEIIPRARVLAGLDAPPPEVPDVDLNDRITWFDGNSASVATILSEIYIAARGLRGVPAFDGQTATVQLPPIVGIRTAVEGLTDDEAKVLAAISLQRGEVLTKLAGVMAAVQTVDGKPSDEQMAELGEYLNDVVGGNYNVTITRAPASGQQ